MLNDERSIKKLGYNPIGMTDLSQRFLAAIGAIDLANSPVPAEVLYSQRMTHWLEKLYPQASEALQLAARAQHIRRWEVPRDSFPMDRAGYHRWRTGLYTFHGDVAAKILQELGYDAGDDWACAIPIEKRAIEGRSGNAGDGGCDLRRVSRKLLRRFCRQA